MHRQGDSTLWGLCYSLVQAELTASPQTKNANIAHEHSQVVAHSPFYCEKDKTGIDE